LNQAFGIFVGAFDKLSRSLAILADLLSSRLVVVKAKLSNLSFS
jgi:hypothetical protein